MVIFDTYLREKGVLIEKALETHLPAETKYPPVIHEAMRYAVLGGGGKRIRPVLTLAVSEMLGASEGEAMIPACAVELIHSYSLIHDDLPCMDNAETRRGKPSCHKKFGEAIALLAGDALLTLAFQLLTTLKPSENNLRLIREIANAVGTSGMIGGQLVDIESAEKRLDLPALDDMNKRKTGALIQVSCLTGAIAAGAACDQEHRILKFGEYLGFAFQVVDDIIDGDGYLQLMNEKAAREKARLLVQKAKEELSSFQAAGETLCLIADALLERKR